MKKKLKTIDLFSGCGGLTEGFESSGLFSTLGIVEWDKPSLSSLVNRLNTKWGYENANEMALLFDMQRTDELLNGWSDVKFGKNNGLKKLIKNQGGKVDIIVGGPPCQAYSIAGRIRDKNGMKNDYRNFLFETYLKVVEEFKPKLFVFENVLGLLSAKPAEERIEVLIRNSFDKIGYTIIDDLKKAAFDVSDFGVPQCRKRLVIIGLNNSYFKGDKQRILSDFYENFLSKYKAPKMTVGEAIFDLPKMRIATDGKNSHEVIGNTFIKNHIPRYHSERDIKIFKELAEDITRKERKYKTVNDLKKLYTETTGKSSTVHKYHVLDFNKPSNTIVAHLYKDGLRHIHPDPKQARSITAREAARLQSFPDDFEFLGSMGDQYKMIGNAVPPLFAKKIALAINNFMNKYL
jgi:DNA (cytosine-5)-methyltransferase 1